MPSTTSSPPAQSWWPLQMARELDDAILVLRTNHTDVGLWIVKTRGDAQAVLASDAALLAIKSTGLFAKCSGMLRRTLRGSRCPRGRSTR